MYGRGEKNKVKIFFHFISPGVKDQHMSYIRTVPQSMGACARRTQMEDVFFPLCHITSQRIVYLLTYSMEQSPS